MRWKLWMKKISVIAITFMTLGVFIPPNYLDAYADNNELSLPDSESDQITDFSHVDQVDEIDLFEESDEFDTDDLIHLITEQAIEQTVNKLGPRIVNKVESDLMSTVMPNMEEVIKDLLIEAEEEDLRHYEVSENPANGYGEKIFNIYDVRTNTEVARFDVRRDIRPKQGYWFNFHYHLSEDDFEEHHHLGDIYWDKNTPPKWMS
ncbi:YpjP family protein [Evansella cellulosilytica]|uniref:YpjP-like protein n=1 Tax=Evansella cellulosilytica (strain ATCC 21833 / DSM 2522 / FERM P-1141 / JCM 9156 / N-4) TaxID=649639 RepID=E6TX29_EVAC2|nr:YpjP family protein [Evansella cellulosilytica]ADU31118.1 hypothetical protein Bcell_2866 [Evansella cellulosilytica DSM 2522]